MTFFHVGTSGWHYKEWRGRFYPEKLATAAWLEYYAGQYNTVELNNTFYRLPSESAFTRWYDATPPGFLFAVKASRLITHYKRLKDCDEALSSFMSRIIRLREKLGPVLFQLPPGLKRDDALLDSFLRILPDNSRYVFEFRHPSWQDEPVYDILHRYDVGFCVFDMPELTSPLIATADFAYIRFHGTGSRYSGSYPDDTLRDWANRIIGLSASLNTVYIYFNNDIGGAAIENAATLSKFLKGTRKIGPS